MIEQEHRMRDRLAHMEKVQMTAIEYTAAVQSTQDTRPPTIPMQPIEGRLERSASSTASGAGDHFTKDGYKVKQTKKLEDESNSLDNTYNSTTSGSVMSDTVPGVVDVKIDSPPCPDVTEWTQISTEDLRLSEGGSLLASSSGTEDHGRSVETVAAKS